MAAKPKVDLSEFRRIKKAGCAFAQLTIKPEHVDTLKEAFQADDISHASIHEWMHARGYKIGKEAITKHRSGRCVCPR